MEVCALVSFRHGRCSSAGYEADVGIEVSSVIGRVGWGKLISTYMLNRIED